MADNPIEIFFSPGGALSRKLPAFEHRAEQARMAAAVAKMLSAGGTLIVEAGTGTGKTLAYLVPLALSGRRALVSTGTKNLQDQLLHKDIPLLAGLGPLRVACLKGRRNYLCRYRLRQFAQRPLFADTAEAAGFGRLMEWAATTPTGDVAEVSWLPENFSAWNEMSASAEQCLGQGCPDFRECFLTRARQEAARSDLVIVNHHLFFADLALRSAGSGEAIPRCDVYVFDEAHQMEEAASAHFGLKVGSHRLRELARDCLRTLAVSGETSSDIEGRVAKLEAATARLARSMGLESGRYPLRQLSEAKGFEKSCAALADALELLRAALTPLAVRSEAFLQLARRSTLIREELAAITRAPAQDGDGSVRWVEVRERGFTLTSTPVEIGDLFRKNFFEAAPAVRTVLFTSATLAVAGAGANRAGCFDYFRQRLGVPKATELCLPSPFDYASQALLYVPQGMCEPGAAEFPERCAAELTRLLEATQGRALVLFTSHRNLAEVARRLKGKKLPWRVMVQGEAPRQTLLEELRGDVHSVLLATASFWEGVDVAGEALSCVAVDRLPFASPGEPLVEARIEKLRRAGKSPFGEYQLPEAVLSLKQGLGRLIRARTDRGVAAVLDVRLLTKQYGKTFLASLPPLKLTRKLEDVKAFLAAAPKTAPPPAPAAATESKALGAAPATPEEGRAFTQCRPLPAPVKPSAVDGAAGTPRSLARGEGSSFTQCRPLPAPVKPSAVDGAAGTPRSLARGREEKPGSISSPPPEPCPPKPSLEEPCPEGSAAEGPAPEKRWSKERLAALREECPQAYARWSEEEDERLKALRGRPVKELAQLFERQPSAIRSRLKKLGLV